MIFDFNFKTLDEFIKLHLRKEYRDVLILHDITNVDVR